MSELMEKDSIQMESPVESGKPKKEKKRREKKPAGAKKKIKKRYIALGLVVVLAIGLFIYSKATAGTTVMPVPAVSAYTGDVEENISASGKVESGEKRVYFAPVAAKIAELSVEVGDEVKAGDLLLSFDTADLEAAKKKADLEVSQLANGYQSALQQSSENQTDYSDASIGLDELKQMKENQKQYVLGLTYQLEDDKGAKRKSLKNWITQLQEELDYQNRRFSEKQSKGEDTKKVQEELENIQGQLYNAQNQLELMDNDEKFKQKQRLIDFEQKKLDDMTEEIQKRESKQSSSEPGILNGYAKKEKAAGVESARLSAASAAEDLAAAQAGVAAEFDGIVTEISAVQGASVTEGAQLITIESSRDVKVTVELSKYDLEKVKEGQTADVTIAGAEYEGKVTKINRMAQNNAQNAPVVNAEISVSNADGSIFLGVEGKASIHTAKAEGAVLIPYEAVNVDKEGDFCYLVKDGVIVKQRIVTGISSDIDVEVKEGISEGDTVATAANMNLVEGMQVMPVLR